MLLKSEMLYDLAVVGGGLAGLALSIQVARQGFRVILFEKEKYPFHRVCGEYVSMESWNFLQELGMHLDELNISRIKRLCLSDINGKSFEQELFPGGFGISRFTLDFNLSRIATQSGVTICEQARILDIHFLNDQFHIDSSIGRFRAVMTAGCFGKRSNLDIKWKRPFIVARKNKLNNFVGVKYHIRHDFPDDLIALHIFKKGYCGISKVEDDQYCLCYLTSADNLRESKNDIELMEKTILSGNPHLKEIFNHAEKLHAPVVISQISFDSKSLIENHVLMIGDTAGMIAPLCGNGMSMALRASKIAAEQIQSFLSGTISRTQMEYSYVANWKTLFRKRLKIGRMLQRLFTSQLLMSVMINIARSFPGVLQSVIGQTHGRTF
jgi:flavin-dependent dehydrogenase